MTDDHPARRPAGSSALMNELHFLLGDWDAVDQSGLATGGFSFETRLLGRVIQRTNYAEYPAAGGKPAFRHEDLMVIYLDDGEALRADYYDNEGHVIRYKGEIEAAGHVIFTAQPAPGQPGFRLTYRLAAPEVLDGRFEVSPPGITDNFSTYLVWSARRAG